MPRPKPPTQPTRSGRPRGRRSESAEDGRSAGGELDRAELLERLRAAEEARVAAERRFNHTVECVADGIVVMDRRGRILFANPAAEGILGRPAEELVGSELGIPVVSGETSLLDLVSDSRAGVAELRVADTTWEEEPALLISVRDVTERHEAEERARTLLAEQLRRRQAETNAARARLLVEASRAVPSTLAPGAILAELARLVAAHLGDHCVLELFGGAGHGPFRRAVASRSSDGSTRIVHSEERPAPDRRPSALQRGIQDAQRVVRVADPDDAWIADAGEDDAEQRLWRSLRPADVIVAPVSAGGAVIGLLAVVGAQDGRPLGEQDDALAAELAYRAGVALENARLLRLAQEGSRAKSDFLAVISHELRTPLTGIMGYGGLLMEEVERPLLPREHGYVQGIMRNADRLLRIIDQILLFARSRSEEERVSYRSLPLGELLEAVATVMRPLAADAGLELEITAGRPDLTITTDVEMTRYILLHLLTNAVKFTEAGRIAVRADATEGTLRLQVSDTGRGIPRDKLDRIFEPFRQADDPNTREVGGTGIGLNVVQNLVRLLGGRVEVESEPGRGSTFTVLLPQPELEGRAGTG